MAVARGEHRIAADEPKVWFTSTESIAKVLSAGNREPAAGHRREDARLARRVGPDYREGRSPTSPAR